MSKSFLAYCTGGFIHIVVSSIPVIQSVIKGIIAHFKGFVECAILRNLLPRPIAILGITTPVLPRTDVGNPFGSY